ncbi:LisH domain-containing protein [Smittium culicis]|uniref:LisH domain-containing protein n=1 Tax=Smittium culicis TaxID=133412 RepID=A0A1R1Y5H1_9FUNG|nr:LisH domain-containing protein [Smittium culicis]
MESVYTANGKLKSAQRKLQVSSEKSLEELIDLVKNRLEKLSEQDEAGADDITILKFKGATTLQDLKNNQKDLYTAVSKQGKVIDKISKIDLDNCCNPKLFEGKTRLLDSEIALHLLRGGNFKLAEVFIKDSNAEIPENIKNEFFCLYSITSDLKEKKLDSAFE